MRRSTASSPLLSTGSFTGTRSIPKCNISNALRTAAASGAGDWSFTKTSSAHVSTLRPSLDSESVHFAYVFFLCLLQSKTSKRATFSSEWRLQKACRQSLAGLWLQQAGNLEGLPCPLCGARLSKKGLCIVAQALGSPGYRLRFARSTKPRTACSSCDKSSSCFVASSWRDFQACLRYH